jgi:hypothetical protein
MPSEALVAIRRASLVFLPVAFAVRAAEGARVHSRVRPQSRNAAGPALPAPDHRLRDARRLFDEAKRANDANEPAKASERVTEAIDVLLEVQDNSDARRADLPCESGRFSPACDTHVGVRRAGQGVASVQRALLMAGARAVITSLWTVPDEATKELMTDFYRRLRVEKKPKWQALWEAKRKLRDARDDAGRPRYSARDWAAWVLTGDPD